MMNRRVLGSAFVSGLMVLAGVTALGTGGYMTITGKTLCGALHGCGEKTAAANCDGKTVKTVAAQEGQKKECCPLGKAKTVAAKSGGCSGEGEAKVTNAAAKSGGCSGEGKAHDVAAKSGGCSGEGKIADAAAMSGECAKKCAGEKVASARRGFFMMGGGVPVAMPAMFYNNKAEFNAATLKDASSCDQPCTGEGKAEAAAHTEGGCSEAKAKDAKSSGQCPNAAEKAAEAQKAGEPVASRQ